MGPATLLLLASAAWAAPAPPAAKSAAPETPEPPWELVGETEGIRSYRRELPGVPVVNFKGDGLVDADLLQAAIVVIDTQRDHEWVDSLVESRLIEQLTPHEHIEYTHVRAPFPISHRDFVSRVSYAPDPGGRHLTVLFRAVEDARVPSNPGIVRGEFLRVTYTLTRVDDRHTHVEASILADPKGWVPKWVVRIFQKNWARNTIRALRLQVAKPYDPRPDLAALFRPAAPSGR